METLDNHSDTAYTRSLSEETIALVVFILLFFPLLLYSATAIQVTTEVRRPAIVHEREREE